MAEKTKRRRFLSIRQKLLTSYLVIVLILIVVGIVGVQSIYRVYANGSTIYNNHLQAVDYLKSVSTNLREIDRNLVILSTDSGSQDRNAYVYTILDLQSENEKLLHNYEQLTSTGLEQRRYQQCRLSIISFDKQVNSIITLLNEGYAGVYTVYEQELAPVKQTAFELIDAMVELSIRSANEKNEENQQLFTRTIFTAVVLCIAATAAAFAIAVYMSGYFIRRLDSIRSFAKRLAAFDISDEMQNVPEDELGATMRALNDSQFMMRDFIEKIVEGSGSLADMGTDVSHAVRRSNERLQAVNVGLMQSAEGAEQMDASVTQLLAGGSLDERSAALLRSILETSELARGQLYDARRELSQVSMKLEQVAVTSDFQNEIAAEHMEQVRKFKLQREVQEPENEPKTEGEGK